MRTTLCSSSPCDVPIFHQPDLTQPSGDSAHPGAQPACWSRAPGAAFPSSPSAARGEAAEISSQQSPQPWAGPGHTQLTGQDLGGSAHSPLHSVCGTPTQQTGALPGTCSGPKVSLTSLSNKQQPPFGFNPSALI